MVSLVSSTLHRPHHEKASSIPQALPFWNAEALPRRTRPIIAWTFEQIPHQVKGVSEILKMDEFRTQILMFQSVVFKDSQMSFFLNMRDSKPPGYLFNLGPRWCSKQTNICTTIYIYTDITYVYSHCLWPPLSNSDHQEYYMFSRESLQAFMHHCYWEGPHPIYTRGVLPFFFWKNCICFNPTWVAIDRIASLKKKTPFLLATFPTVSKNKNLWQTQE